MKKGTASDAHHTWFESFVNAVDGAEERSNTAAILDEGASSEENYPTQCIEWGDDEHTPLHYAAEEDDLKAVRTLTKKLGSTSANIQTRELRVAPFHLADSARHLEMVKSLIENGADYRRQGF